MEIESRGFRVHYEVVGDGDPILLLPGVLMEGRRWFETGYVELLSDRHRVIVVDPLGFGLSDKPVTPESYSAAALVEDTIAVLDQEQVESVALWGYSRGAALAADVAAHYPARVSRLVCGGNPITVPRTSLQKTPEEVRSATLGEWSGVWELMPPLPDDVKATMEDRNDPRVFAAVSVAPVEDLDASSITCPALLYVGGGEWFVAFVEESAKLLSARFTVIGDRTCGHAETFQAVELVVPLVEDFLATA
jgi:pimeloyl-ACP methyl ester carboxylesterase